MIKNQPAVHDRSARPTTLACVWHARVRLATGCYLVCILILCRPVVAIAQDAEVDYLRGEVERMGKVIEVQNKALLNLERRLRSLEEATPTPGQAPSAPLPPRAIPTPDTSRGTAPDQAPVAGADEAPAKKEADAPRSLEVAAGEAQGFFGQRFSIEPAITYSHTDRSQIILNGFLALDAIFLGNLSVDEVESDIVTFDVTGRMGIGEDIQLDVNVPYVYRTSNFISGGAGGGSTSLIEEAVDMNYLGDISAGINYRVFNETESTPDVVVNLRGRAPTGKDPFGIELEEVPGSQGNLMVPEELPTGNGVWQVSGGVSFLKTIDPALLFASVDYYHNFERDFDDIGSNSGNQPGTVDIGDSIQFGFGAAYALNERFSLSLSYTQRMFEKSRSKVDGGSWQDIIGSDANVARLNTGMTYAINDNVTLVSNVAVGLTDDAPDVEIRFGFPISF